MGNMVDATGFFTTDPGCYNYTHLGTAAGTTTIASVPAFLSHIQVLTRTASGTIIAYDSIGTSANVIGTATLGTQTFSDPVPFVFKIKTKNALTIVNSTNLELLVAALP